MSCEPDTHGNLQPWHSGTWEMQNSYRYTAIEGDMTHEKKSQIPLRPDKLNADSQIRSGT